MRLIPHLTSAQKWTTKLSNILALQLTQHLTNSTFIIIFFILFQISKDSYQKENMIGFTITWNPAINPTNVTQTLNGLKVIKMAFLSSLIEMRAPQMEGKLTMLPKRDVAFKWTQTTKANKKKRQAEYKYIVNRCILPEKCQNYLKTSSQFRLVSLTEKSTGQADWMKFQLKLRFFVSASWKCYQQWASFYFFLNQVTGLTWAWHLLSVQFSERCLCMKTDYYFSITTNSTSVIKVTIEISSLIVIVSVVRFFFTKTKGCYVN